MDMETLNRKAEETNRKSLNRLYESRSEHKYKIGEYIFAKNFDRRKTDSLRSGPFEVVGIR